MLKNDRPTGTKLIMTKAQIITKMLILNDGLELTDGAPSKRNMQEKKSNLFKDYR